jgi:hypothetical protein
MLLGLLLLVRINGCLLQLLCMLQLIMAIRLLLLQLLRLLLLVGSYPLCVELPECRPQACHPHLQLLLGEEGKGEAQVWAGGPGLHAK